MAKILAIAAAVAIALSLGMGLTACAGADREDTPESTAPSNLPKDSSFTCTFLDVGQGDCAIIQCDGHCMIIDGGNPQASSAVYNFVKKAAITHFDYLVATHDDADHVGGLPAALQLASVGTAYCPVTSSDKDAFLSLVKYLGNQNVKLECPKAGDAFELGSARVQVIAPAKADSKDNDDSLVLRVTYGSTSILFAGDAEEAEETEMLGSGFKLESSILKVAHHGSASSTSAPFLKAVKPAIAIISVGADNTYGHPTNEALSRLDACGAKIFRTDLQGTITATSDGKAFTLETQREAKTPTNVSQADQKAANGESAEEAQYIGNARSRKFHRPGCRYLPEEKNQVILKSRSKAIDSGYSPCGVCQP